MVNEMPKLDTAEAVMAWAKKTWPCDFPDCEPRGVCVQDEEVAKHLAKCVRLHRAFEGLRMDGHDGACCSPADYAMVLRDSMKGEHDAGE